MLLRGCNDTFLIIHGTFQHLSTTPLHDHIEFDLGSRRNLARLAQIDTRGYYALTKLTPRTGSLDVKL